MPVLGLWKLDQAPNQPGNGILQTKCCNMLQQSSTSSAFFSPSRDSSKCFLSCAMGWKRLSVPRRTEIFGVPNSWTWQTTQLLHQGSFSCPKAEVTQWPSRLLRRNLDSPLGRPQGAKTKRSLDHCNVFFFGVHLTWKPGSLVSVSSRFNWKKNTVEHVSITILLLLCSVPMAWSEPGTPLSQACPVWLSTRSGHSVVITCH